MGEISEVTRQTNSGTQEASMSVSYLAELADQLRASVSTFRLPERAHQMVDVFPEMNSMQALPGSDGDHYYQQDMGMNNDWNQGFSSDFLSLPQPQESDNAGAYQYAFNNQQDFSSQPGFAPQFSGSAYSGEQGFDGQPFGSQQGFSGQQFASQPGMQTYNSGMGQHPGDMGGFDNQQNFDGQFDFGEPGFGNQHQPYYPPSNQTPGVPQQNFSSQTGPNPRQRMRNPGQNQSGFSQDQVPFPNSGYLGQ